jgi:hypothetical protein
MESDAATEREREQVQIDLMLFGWQKSIKRGATHGRIAD